MSRSIIALVVIICFATTAFAQKQLTPLQAPPEKSQIQAPFQAPKLSAPMPVEAPPVTYAAPAAPPVTYAAPVMAQPVMASVPVTTMQTQTVAVPVTRYQAKTSYVPVTTQEPVTVMEQQTIQTPVTTYQNVPLMAVPSLSGNMAAAPVLAAPVATAVATAPVFATTVAAPLAVSTRGCLLGHHHRASRSKSVAIVRQ